MMNFFKNHDKLRLFLMLLLFVLGVALTIFGWTLTGQLLGLCIMLLGIIFILAALFVYNHGYK